MTGLTPSVFASKANQGPFKGKSRRQIAQLKIDQVTQLIGQFGLKYITLAVQMFFKDLIITLMADQLVPVILVMSHLILQMYL